MVNPVENITLEIKKTINEAIKSANEKGKLPCTFEGEIMIEVPREKGHGDFSTNIAMLMAKQAKTAPRAVAEVIIDEIKQNSSENISEVTCAGPGFINFKLSNKWLYEALKMIKTEKEDYGRINIGQAKKVMVEFVSANPTGPLHMGNARGGALGDCIASVLEAAGYDVTREFYINDAGNQIDKFGISLEARYIQQLKGEDAIVFPEDGYQGEDIIERVKEYIEINGSKLLDSDEATRRNTLIEFSLGKNLDRIKNDLKTYGVEYDVWFSEKSLYESGEILKAVELLKEKNATIEKDGALWFKAAEYGAEKDEVLVRNNGLPTYFASDIAYHRNKFEKRGFDRVINLLGADHHGHVARMKGAVSACGINADKLEFVIFQLVRLYRNGEIARMSKRTGRAISLIDLLDEVGRDAARFFFNTKTSGSHLDFDLDLAVQQSNENPVYYVQYAHARICSMLKLLESEGVNVPEIDGVQLDLLLKTEEIDLIRKLAEYPDEIRIAAQTLEPSRLTRYVQDVAALFHSFYNACRVRGEEESLMKARLFLVQGTGQVIRNVLSLLSISAPERM